MLSERGQATIRTIEDAFVKPGNQDVVISLLTAVAKYFASIVPAEFSEDDITAICDQAEFLCSSGNKDVEEVVIALQDTTDKVQAYLSAITVLACLSVKLVNPVFSRTDAIGTVMRKKIKHISDPVIAQLTILRS